MKCIVLYHEQVTDYLLKYDLAENTENGEEGNEVNKARFRLLYFVVNAFLWQDSVKQDALNEVKHNV